jgi:aspartyl-tRNA(Asn)/glutamyl-tRNA(Gln) amidotransferase subunit A
VFPLSFSLDHVGPMTRTVEDNAILFDALAGHDPADPGSARRGAPDCRGALGLGVQGLRIGVIEHFYREDMPGDSDMIAGIDAAIEQLGQLGAQISRVRLSPLQRFADCGRTILLAEAYAVHERDLRERPEDYAAITRGKLLPGAFIGAAEYIKAQQWRRVLADEFARAMAGLDAVITLSSMTLPCRIDDENEVTRTYERQCRMPFNVTGTPAIAIPAGMSPSGIPLGIQIGAKAFDEPMVYRIANALFPHALRPPERLAEMRNLPL